ncbi:MAG: peptide-methionine (R)-S-oxide reductase [Deltaproteobacteria bacterium]|nr:MAG: peptide-methionine (R)-S-oxide reductase [Deltaproteobacteria bacterium]
MIKPISITVAFAVVVSLFFGTPAQCGSPKVNKHESNQKHIRVPHVHSVNWKKKTKKYWKKKLTSKQFYVCRNAGTEMSFTGKHLRNKKPGVFVCSSCGHVLFDAKTKFKSGTGWPSFYDVYKKRDSVKVHIDKSYGMVRVEVVCGRCNAHLGHVFRDGPRPTGLRYCINSVCLGHRPYSYAKKYEAFLKKKRANMASSRKPAPRSKSK